MYEEHFNFSQPPFQLSPDNDIFYASKGHKKAFSYLEFGIGKREGFIVITGEIGAGKTTLIEHLFANLDDDDLITVRLGSSQFDSTTILTIVADGLGLNISSSDKANVSLSINKYLKKCVDKDQHVLIVIDEAQNIPLDTLEELRMLTNFQHKGVSPMQIFLLGQPEFRDTLNSPRLEQLRQRVVARYHLGPLKEEEVPEYINYRLNSVLCSDEQHIFNEEGYPLIYKASSGIPRIINTICDRCLISAYLDDLSTVELATLQDVLHELDQEHSKQYSDDLASYTPIVDDVDFLI